MIQVENTPNPESLKFLSEQIISNSGTEEFQKNNIDKISNSFIKELLNFKGVELVLLSKNFLSVKKNNTVSWNELKPMVISHINQVYANDHGKQCIYPVNLEVLHQNTTYQDGYGGHHIGKEM